MKKYDFECLEKRQQSFRELYRLLSDRDFYKVKLEIIDRFTVKFEHCSEEHILIIRITEQEWGIDYLGDRLYKGDEFFIVESVYADLMYYTQYNEIEEN